MKRLNSDVPPEPIVKKSKSRWDVGPNDIENKGLQPKSEIKKNTQKYNGEASTNLDSFIKFLTLSLCVISSAVFQ